MDNVFKVKKVKLNVKSDWIEKFIIVSLIFVSSWKFVLPSTWLDEVFLILLFSYFILFNKSMKKMYIRVIALYIIWCLLGCIVNTNANFYSLFMMIDNLKPILVFCVFMSLKISKNQALEYKKICEIINIPSVIVGILNGYLYSVLGNDLIIDSGSYKWVDGILIHRAGGLIGHSGEFTELCAILFLLVLFVDKNCVWKYLKMALYFIGVCAGRGRVPFVLIFCGVIWYLWLHINHKHRKRLIVIIVMLIIISIYPMYRSFSIIYAFDIEYQIRFVALRKIIDLLSYVVFLGVGCGAVGNTYSANYNNQLYQKLDISRYSGYDWESTFAKCMIQTGVIGTFLWYFVFVDAFIKLAKKHDTVYKNISLLLMGYYLINCLINKSYVMPCLGIISIFVSSVFAEDTNKMEKS